MKTAHLTTVDMSLRYLILPQLLAAAEHGEVIGISAPGPYVEELESRGIRHVPLKSSTRGAAPLSDMKAAIQLWRILKDERVDILHTHNPKPGVYGRIVGRLAGVPIVVNTIHGLYASDDAPATKRAIVYGLEWFASRFSDLELVQSPEDYQLLLRLGITPRSRTQLLGNGVDLDRFNPENARAHREEIRSELGVAPDDVVVGMVGRLVLEKGIPELIEAAEALGSGYVVVIAGPHDPVKSDAVSDEMIRRGGAVGVRFLGMREDVDRLYGGFDIFVLPSHREGFPRAAMEAAASGLPVIATDIRGCRQVVEPGVNGQLFPVGNVDALSVAIRAIGDQPETMREMGAASASKAIEEFDEDLVVRRVMAAYADLASVKGLDWAVVEPGSEINYRDAELRDARAIAELHRQMIATGFLSSLGALFLELLYQGLIEFDGAHVGVAMADGAVVAFIAGTENTGAFYKFFLRRHGLRALLRLLPSLLRPAALKRIYETLRYGSNDSRADSELLSMAVAPAAQKRGVGQHLVDNLLVWAKARKVPAMTVVVAQTNEPAVRLYNNSGFVNGRRVEVHVGDASWEFLWSG